MSGLRSVRRWPARPVWAAALAAAASALACSEYDASLLHTSRRPDASIEASAPADASEAAADRAGDQTPADVYADAAKDAEAEPPVVDPRACDTCKDMSLVRPPCPPTVPDPASPPDPLVLAVRSMRLGMNNKNTEDWKDLGIDFDCIATPASGSPAPCARVQGTPSATVEDGHAGRDNSFGRNIGGLVCLLESWNLLKNVEETGNADLESGSAGLLLIVEGFGGGRDDPLVRVGIVQSDGTRDAAGANQTKALWDGNDLWSRVKTGLDANGNPTYFDDAAYVTGGVVVAHLPDGLPIRFETSSGTLEMLLNKSVLMFTLSADNQKATEGVVAGVWHTQGAMSAFDSYAAQSGICPSNPNYKVAREALSKSSDIRLDLKPMPALECNAMSLGLGFTAQRAKLGAIVEAPPKKPDLCGDAGADAG
jgi:hypothetical protein